MTACIPAPLTPANLERARRLCVELVLHACNDEHGRDESDAVYKRVTENRDGPSPLMRAKYSSCADLAHWMYRCVGVRADWLNRDDDADAQLWRSGVNLNWLCPEPIGKCPIARNKLTCAPEPGDVFVENNAHGGHVFVAVAYDAATDTLTSAEYGQPGGKLKRRVGFTPAFNKRPYSHIRLAEVLASGACQVPPDVGPLGDRLTGEVLDALEGYMPYVP
jgi:hypothetical protein